MNYLAHLYLSGDDEEILVGNFIGDYVKGKNFLNFSENIQRGILLHRKIDSFTDNHEIFREAKKYFINEFNLYSGIIIDFLYDHFLAVNWHLFADHSLRSFAKKTHAVLLSNYKHLPARVQGFLPFLIQNKRLESYSTIEGIQKSIEIMSRYTSLPKKSEKAIAILKDNFSFLEAKFFIFMQELIHYVENDQHIKINQIVLAKRV